MPYKSEAQRKFFHTASAAKAGITPSEVHEFDKASKGEHLPEYAAEGGEMEDALNGCGQELIDAVHSKDHGKMLDALRALISHMSLEGESDEKP